MVPYWSGSTIPRAATWPSGPRSFACDNFPRWPHEHQGPRSISVSSAAVARCANGAEGCAMKALTIKQPWAKLIFEGGKDIENRSWPTGVRGRVAIHTSLGLSWEVWLEAEL